MGRRKPSTPAAIIPPPASRAKRGASAWDMDHPPKAYRDIPDEFHQELKELADELGVSIGALMYFFARIGKAEYDAGKIEIPTRPKSRRHEIDL
jgi:hypothetical protein